MLKKLGGKEKEDEIITKLCKEVFNFRLPRPVLELSVPAQILKKRLMPCAGPTEIYTGRFEDTKSMV